MLYRTNLKRANAVKVGFQAREGEGTEALMFSGGRRRSVVMTGNVVAHLVHSEALGSDPCTTHY